MTLQATAARIGGHHWFEQSLWRLLGGWAPITDDPAASVLLDIHAQHAAWRAGQWWERLPVLAAIERDELIRPPSPALSVAVGHLEGNAGPRTTVGRLAAGYRFLLPRLLACYQDEAGELSVVSDGPARRTLAQVDVDAVADWRAGEALVQRLLVDRSAVEEVVTTVAALERLAIGHPAGEAAE